MKKFLFILIVIFVFLPPIVLAQDVLEELRSFNIEANYDFSKRADTQAVLVKITPRLYWYADDSWWNNLAADKKELARGFLNSLTEEFEGHIYPALTGIFGFEWTPGIDKDTRITILIHPMKKGAGGYTNTADEYPKTQAPASNEREIIYLNSQFIDTDQAKVFLAHEFVHLITFNQKDRTFGVSDDVWLNEARAEYSSTLLGYDKNYEGSNLQRRVRDFLDSPFDSLTEWKETSADYGVANLFIQYLVDHYGQSILADSLKMRKTGVDSINTSLGLLGFKSNFSQIFIDWALTVLLNDCQIAEKYCYLNENLKSFRLSPLINYLPFVGNSTLSVTNTTKDWSGNWHRFVGGRGELKVEFKGQDSANFKIPYLIQDSKGNIKIDSLIVNKRGEGQIILEDFGSQNISLTIIPIAQNKYSNFSNAEPSYSFFWSASTQGEAVEPAPVLAKEAKEAELRAKITAIQLEIIRLLRQLIALLQQQLAAL